MNTIATAAALADGIYYDMPEDAYHAIPRLSASGVRNMLISPMTFWTRSWMNPRREEQRTIFMDKGKAYHCRVLEGVEAFNARYAYALDPANYPGALVKVDDMKAWIRTFNEQNASKLAIGGNKPELIERILEVDPDVEIWDAMTERHEKENAGRMLLPPDWQFDLERDAAFIEGHPVVKNCFVGGKPEVTILWTHVVEMSDGSGRKVGVQMKTRIDRLKSRAMIDFKTYGNSSDKPLMKAITGAMAQGRYHIQAGVYYRCEEYAMAQGWIDRPKDEARQFVFVFQGTGDDPTPVARILDRRNSWIDLAQRRFDDACATYARFTETHGADMWIEDGQIEVFAEEDFPAWMAD